MTSEQRDADLLDLILELIAHIQRRISAMTLSDFERNTDEIDLTAFRLAHIGEASKKLSDALRLRHPEVRWREMRRMRNVVSHDYDAIAPSLIWKVATEELGALALICRAELQQLEP